MKLGLFSLEDPAPSVVTGEIERFVVDQIQQIGTDPQLIAEAVRHYHPWPASSLIGRRPRLLSGDPGSGPEGLEKAAAYGDANL